MMRTTRIGMLVVLLAAACGKSDPSAATDKASKDLREAEYAAAKQRTDLSVSAADVERRKRALVAEQQQLADREAALVVKGQQLGAAQGTVAEAAATYRAAVTARLAKVDADLASLGTRVDPASKDRAAGLAVRRDRLASLIAAIPGSADATWAAYTKNVDETFDAIEADLHSSTH